MQQVPDRVEVTSRRAGDEQAWTWTSDGKGTFSVEEAEEESPDSEIPRGTRVALHFKKGEDGYLSPAEIRRIVAAYSDHIAIPIFLEGDGESGAADGGAEAAPLNQASALWTRPKSEIADEQYREFYHHVGHAFDEPWTRLHFKVEGVFEYTGLLFIPSSPPFDLFHPDRRHRVKLYYKKQKLRRMKYICLECGQIFLGLAKSPKQEIDCPYCED